MLLGPTYPHSTKISVQIAFFVPVPALFDRVLISYKCRSRGWEVGESFLNWIISCSNNTLLTDLTNTVVHKNYYGMPLKPVSLLTSSNPAQESPSRSRYPSRQTPVAHRSTTSLNEGRGPGVTTALVSPHRRQLPQPPGSRTGSQLSLTGKGPPLAENRGDGVLENGYHPNMNQHIAMAIRSGQSPYAIYGLEEMGDEDDWC